MGPNASGKSNLLDVFRFLHDIAKPSGGGLVSAIEQRGGINKIRCLSARQDNDIRIEIALEDKIDNRINIWKYILSISIEPRGQHKPFVLNETVKLNDREILTRPNKADDTDRERLYVTALEQINENKKFRELVEFLAPIKYLHIIPQIIKRREFVTMPLIQDDPYGQGFVQEIAKTPKNTRDARIKRIKNILSQTVPQLNDLDIEKDKFGYDHLKIGFKNWRLKPTNQNEDQFSDGTLRLAGLLWSILDAKTVLLLEEPELSLHNAIIKYLPKMFYELSKAKQTQILVTTHSYELLQDSGISLSEIYLLHPTDEGTIVKRANKIDNAKVLLDSGFVPSEIVNQEMSKYYNGYPLFEPINE